MHRPVDSETSKGKILENYSKIKKKSETFAHCQKKGAWSEIFRKGDTENEKLPLVKDISSSDFENMISKICFLKSVL